MAFEQRRNLTSVVRPFARPQATEFWGFTGTAPDNKENEPFLKWLLVLASTSDEAAPQVFSTSYGEDEDSVTPACGTSASASASALVLASTVFDSTYRL